MPKEARVASSLYMHRVAPVILPSEVGNATRPTSNWLVEDDETLMSARASGLNWQPIAAKYFPGKTANACRKRHERLMDRRNAQDWDGLKLETLARAYIEMRQELWQPLANHIGEKWNVVEAKCMEKGLKNLQAVYRSAQRRERDEVPQPVSYSVYPTYNSTPAYHQVPYHHASASGGSTGRLSIQAMLSPSPSAVG